MSAWVAFGLGVVTGEFIMFIISFLLGAWLDHTPKDKGAKP